MPTDPLPGPLHCTCGKPIFDGERLCEACLDDHRLRAAADQQRWEEMHIDAWADPYERPPHVRALDTDNPRSRHVLDDMRSRGYA